MTGPDPTPFEVSGGKVRRRHDLRTTHEEADVVMVQQMVHIASAGATSIRVNLMTQTCSCCYSVFVLLLVLLSVIL